MTRIAVPHGINDWIVERENTLRDHLNRNEDPPQAILDAYRHPPLKQHLLAETHGKCVYCESKITHVYFGDVEHIRPKSIFQHERLSIPNLTVACAKCNNAKGEYWDDVLPLINPYSDHPSAEFLAFGYMIARRPGHNRARITIELLGLNRPDLLERRKERIESLEDLADQYMVTPDGPLRGILREKLLNQSSDGSEYAMIVRAYLEAACNL